MLAAMTHPSRVLNLDIKAEAFFKPKSYIHIYIFNALNPLKSELFTKQACRDAVVVYSLFFLQQHILRSTHMY